MPLLTQLMIYIALCYLSCEPLLVLSLRVDRQHNLDLKRRFFDDGNDSDFVKPFDVTINVNHGNTIDERIKQPKKRFVQGGSNEVVILLPRNKPEQSVFAVGMEVDMDYTAESERDENREQVVPVSSIKPRDKQIITGVIKPCKNLPSNNKNCNDIQGPVIDLEESKKSPVASTSPSPQNNSSRESIGHLLTTNSSLSGIEGNPDWVLAKQIWQSAWHIHVYSLGIAFAILAVYSALSIMRLSRNRNFLSRNYFLSLNSALLVLGVSRATLFLVDGYNSDGTFPLSVAYILYNIAFPCITSAFSILFLALLEATNVRLLSANLQTPGALTIVIMMHFLFCIGADIIVGEYLPLKLLLLLCQIIFVSWLVILCWSYIYIFQKVYSTSLRHQMQFKRILQTKASVLKERKKSKLMIGCVIKVALITVMFGLICSALHLYSMTGVYGVYSLKAPEPWSWWTLKLAIGISEMSMCITLSYAATQPLKYHRRATNESCWAMYLLPCRMLFATRWKRPTESAVKNICPVNVQANLPIARPIKTEEAKITESANRANSEVLVSSDTPPNVRTLDTIAPDKNVTEVQLRKKSSESGQQRPRSMLISDKGFLRFRVDGDPEGELIMTDDELDANNDEEPAGDTTHKVLIPIVSTNQVSVENRCVSKSAHEHKQDVSPLIADGFQLDDSSRLNTSVSNRPHNALQQNADDTPNGIPAVVLPNQEQTVTSQLETHGCRDVSASQTSHIASCEDASIVNGTVLLSDNNAIASNNRADDPKNLRTRESLAETPCPPSFANKQDMYSDLPEHRV